MSSTYIICQHKHLAETDMETMFAFPDKMIKSFCKYTRLAIVNSKVNVLLAYNSTKS